MTTLATETWTQADGPSWPAGWSAVSKGGLSVTANRGVITPNNPGYSETRSFLTRSGPYENTEVYVEATFPTLEEQYADVSVRAQVVDLYAPSGYFVQLTPAGTSWNLASGYGYDKYADILTPFTYVANVPISVRLQSLTLSGLQSTVRARVWLTGTTEPTTWVTQAASASADFQNGYVALGDVSGGSVNPTVAFDNLVVTDGVAEVTPTPTLDTSRFFQFF
jgi:hypothetical protein